MSPNKRSFWRFPLGICFVGFFLELHVIFVFVLERIPAEGCLVNFASSVERGACCSQDVWGLCGFRLTFNGFSLFSWDLLCMVLHIFLPVEITIGKSGDTLIWRRWRRCQATRVLHLGFHNSLWVLEMLSTAPLQNLPSNWASHIRGTRLPNKGADNLQIQSTTAATSGRRESLGQVSVVFTLPGLHVPLRNRSHSIEFTDRATGAGEPWGCWACELQWSLLCLPQQHFGNRAFGQKGLILNTLQPESALTFFKSF